MIPGTRWRMVALALIGGGIGLLAAQAIFSANGLVISLGELVVALPLSVIAFVTVRNYVEARFVRLSQLEREQTKIAIERAPESVDVRFAQMGGITEVAERLMPMVEWLRRPQDDLGVNIPRGVLIAGPSGTGKTMLARAMAGEAGRPLFAYHGSEFNELLVGMGSTRLREVFAAAARQARRDAPCVLFIDQVDLIAAERSAAQISPLSSENETYRTLAQLLAELDDLSRNGRVFVVAATSRPRILDPALSAPGRLSHLADLPLPDQSAREEILAVHVGSRPLCADVELAVIARHTDTFSGAELAQLVWHAADVADGRPVVAGQPSGELRRDDFVAAMKLILPQPREQQPAQIVRHLDDYIVGQQAAKKRLAVAVSNHYLRLLHASRLESAAFEIKKSNILIVGPTGSGKTMLIETIADYLDVPYVIFNSTVLTATGHSGASVEQILYELLIRAGMNRRRAEYGIVCIDEFDKLAFSAGGRFGHSSATVQQELLKLVEGTVVEVPKSGGGRHGTGSDAYQFDTRNVLFVGVGAFSDLDAVIAERLRVPLTPGSQRLDLRARVQPEDIVNYGFIPELVGRFPVLSNTNELTTEELKEILRNPRNGLIREYSSLLSRQGSGTVSFDDDAAEQIAVEAQRRRIGARGLRTIMEDVLLDMMYDRHELAGCSPVRIDRHRVAGALDSGLTRSGAGMDLTPQQVLAGLDKRLPGNVRAKNLLAHASAQHYGHLADAGPAPSGALADVGPPAGPRPPGAGARRNPAILLVDPYVRQRGRLVSALADTWGVPRTVVRADRLERSLNARAGPRNAFLLEPVLDLLEQAGGQPDAAERGIVFVDDFDLSLSRVTVDPFYNTLDHLLLMMLQGRPLYLQTAHGQPFEFPTERLFLVLGGDFHFPHSRTGSFNADQDLRAKYEPDKILGNLVTEFNLTPELLTSLLVATTDTAMTHDDLMEMIRACAEQLAQKYRPLLDGGRQRSAFSASEREQIASLARDRNLTEAEIAIELESLLMRKLHGPEADSGA